MDTVRIHLYVMGAMAAGVAAYLYYVAVTLSITGAVYPDVLIEVAVTQWTSGLGYLLLYNVALWGAGASGAAACAGVCFVGARNYQPPFTDVL